jgi:antagonist of KipI
MTHGSVHVIRPGLQTTVQDLGRRGYQAYGVPVAGPMDPFAHRRANALVGNSREAATLEIAFVGPELVFEDERVVATAGAMFALTVESHGVPHDQPFVVRAGARLRFGARAGGVRAYLAVGGGFDVPVVMGSRSTYLDARMGGHHGRTLMAGDRLRLGDARRNATAARRTLVREFPPGGGTRVRVLPGPHADRFAGDGLEVLQAQPYEITADSNRMGFRLRGAPLTHTRGADLISESTTWGGLQVPASGQPILLMADRQTTGGYPIVATVITADLSVAAQAAPGDSLRFAICSRAEALSALLAAERELLALENGA